MAGKIMRTEDLDALEERLEALIQQHTEAIVLTLATLLDEKLPAKRKGRATAQETPPQADADAQPEPETPEEESPGQTPDILSTLDETPEAE